MDYDDDLVNQETGKPLTPKELKGVLAVTAKMREVIERKKTNDARRAKQKPWDGS